MAGDADCLKCKNASDFEYKDPAVNFKLLSLKCNARGQTMYVFKGFYCWYFEKK